MNSEKKKIVLATGGTGGHIFPAEALAGILAERGYNPVLITDKRFRDYSGSLTQHESYIIKSSAIGGGLIGRLKSYGGIFIGYFQAVVLLAKIKPHAVVGFGGYPSFPTVLAAASRRIKTIIHEQNSILGKANFFLAPKVDVIATSFPEVKGIQGKDLDKIILTGNPVRASIKALRDMPYPEFREDSIFKILVIGGSQGAGVFSRVVPEAIKLIPQELRNRIRIDQQCRPEDIEMVKEFYKELGISADLTTFFNDIPARLASCHLVICRAGATSLAEVTVAGRPAIMVPYPKATDNHQMVNANAVEDAGGGWVIPEDSFTAETLSKRLEALIRLPSTLVEAAANSKIYGRYDADKQLADLVEKVVSGA